MPKTILVADDSKTTLAPLALSLQKAGYDTLVLTPADDPVEQFGKAVFELVFLSLCDGKALAACQGIRDNPDGAIMPIIFVGTGAEAVGSPADALTQGGDYYFGEPLDITKVLAKVQTYVGVGSKSSEIVVSPPPAAAPSTPVPHPGLAHVPTSIASPMPLADEQTTPAPPEPSMEDSTPLSSDRAGEPAASPEDLLPEAARKFPGLPEFSWGDSGAPPVEESSLTAASDALLKTLNDEQAEGTAAEPAKEPDKDSAGGDADDKASLESPSDEEAARLEEEAELKAKLDSQREADEQAMRRAEEEAKEHAEAEVRRKAEEEIRQRSEADARRKAEEEIRRHAEAEARRKAEEAARRRVEEETRRKAEEEARRKAEEEARRKVEEETRRRARSPQGEPANLLFFLRPNHGT